MASFQNYAGTKPDRRLPAYCQTIAIFLQACSRNSSGIMPQSLDPDNPSTSPCSRRGTSKEIGSLGRFLPAYGWRNARNVLAARASLPALVQRGRGGDRGNLGTARRGGSTTKRQAVSEG